MLKSAAQASPTAPKKPGTNATSSPDPDASGAAAKKKAKPRRNQAAKFVRWLHTYVSMFGLLSVLFFSITGITLNHPDWFFSGAQSLRHEEGAVDAAWLGHGPDGEIPLAMDGDAVDSVARLEIVEHLRTTHGIRGALTEFTADDFECVVMFKGPGYSADAFIDRENGEYTLTESYAGFVAVVNDLHKGRDSGAGWKWLIDISAVVLTLASASGLALMIFIKRRRRTGLITAGVGAVLLVLVYVIFVP